MTKLRHAPALPMGESPGCVGYPSGLPDGVAVRSVGANLGIESIVAA